MIETPPRLRRAVLYVPADKPRAIEKAAGLGADGLILDLEDAVAPEAKAAARAGLAESLARWAGAGAERLVRVNAGDQDDLQAAAGADGIVLPKVEDAGPLQLAASLLGPDAPPVWAMIETPRGVLNLSAIAEAGRRAGLIGLIAGTNDLAAVLRLPEGARARQALAPHLAQIVLIARAFDLIALDGVYNDYQDTEGFAAEAAAGRALGFDGKTLIHPSQVGPAQTAFAPTEAERAEARAILAAFNAPENAGKGAIAVNGRMVERLHLARARAVLAAAGDFTDRR